MKSLVMLSALLLLAPPCLRAQTREETVGFLKSEFKSFESVGYRYEEVDFSPGGETMTLRRTAKDKKQYLVTFEMKDVDIYKVTIHHANGIDKHQIMVRVRGLGPRLVRDGSTSWTPMKITPAMEDEKKCDALARAFTRLITLTTGRKFLFSQ